MLTQYSSPFTAKHEVGCLPVPSYGAIKTMARWFELPTVTSRDEEIMIGISVVLNIFAVVDHQDGF